MRYVFISYKFSDRELAHSIDSFFQPQGGQCQGKAAFVKNDVADQGSAAIEREIQEVMRGCVAVLFIVGDDSHNSPWIEYEAKLARSWEKPMFAVRHPGAAGGPPNEIRNEISAVLQWSQNVLCDALNAVNP